jgi:hypothetical protein
MHFHRTSDRKEFCVKTWRPVSRPAGRSAWLGGAAAALLLIAGAAGAVTSESFDYPAAKIGYRVVPPAAMFPTDLGSMNGYVSAWGFLRFVNNAPLERGCFNSGVNLPQGARVESVEVFYSGPFAGTGFVATLLQNDLATGTVSVLATGAMPNAEARTSLLLGMADGIKIGNKRYSYTFNLCLGEEDMFYGARVKYTYKNAGD